MASTCPKCGYASVETDECPRCRVIISKYRAHLERVGQPPAGAAPASPGAAPSAVGVGPWPEGSPAGFWVRGAALVVDGLVLGAAFLPFQLFVVFPTLFVGGITRPDPVRAFAVKTGYNVVAFVVGAAYIVWMHGQWGQTLGKMATGVRVLNVNGGPIGYGRAFGRWLGTALSTITLGIGYLMAALRSDKRALHDLVAGTRVIKVRRPSLEGKPAGFWMRFAALVIDWEVLLLLALPFGIAVAIVTPVAASARPRAAVFAAAVLLTTGLFLMAFTILYSIWMHGKWGQTLGKMALGMEVVRSDGSPLGYGGAFLRWLGSIVSMLILLIGYIMAGLRTDKRALHDLIAGSRVTYVR